MIKTFRLVLKELAYRVKNDEISAWASQLTFYMILSIFPFMIFLVEIINRVDFINLDAVYLVIDFLPQEIQSFIDLILQDIDKNSVSNTILPLTIFASLWAASKGFMAIIKSLNIAYDQKETRSFIMIRLIAVVYTLAFALLIFLILILIVFGGKIMDILFNYFPFLTALNGALDLFRYVIAIVITYLFFIVIYNASPNQKISIKDVTPGALFASLAWMIVSTGFSIYINNSNNLSYLYGSLTSIIILLLWLFITSMIIMIGGELNAITLHIKTTQIKTQDISNPEN